MDSAELESVVKNIIGPVVLAVCLNTYLYGFCFVRFVQYQTAYARDSMLTQLTVCWTFMLDTAHTAASIYMLWYFVVVNFMDPAVLSSVPWPYLSTPIFIVLTSLPVQHFFAWRIKRFSRSWPLFMVLSVLSLVSTGFGLANSFVSFLRPSANPLKTLLPLADAWLAMAMMCDGMIAVLLLYYLIRSRTGVQRTDSIISRLIHSTVETTALNALICLCDIIILNVLPNTNYNLMCALPMGRVYTCTLLAMLNSRISIREEFNASEHAMQNQPTRSLRFNIVRTSHSEAAVNVDFDQQNKIDPASSVKGAPFEPNQAYSMRGDIKPTAVIV